MRVKRAIRWVLAAGALVGLAAPALADRRPAVRRPVARSASAQPAPRAQHMRFGDDLVEGARAMGGGSLVSATRPAKRSRLLITRVSFIPELIKSAEDL